MTFWDGVRCPSTSPLGMQFDKLQQYITIARKTINAFISMFFFLSEFFRSNKLSKFYEQINSINWFFLSSIFHCCSCTHEILFYFNFICSINSHLPLGFVVFFIASFPIIKFDYIRRWLSIYIVKKKLWIFYKTINSRSIGSAFSSNVCSKVIQFFRW